MVLLLTLPLLLLGTARAAPWLDTDCFPAGANTNDTLPGQPAVCSYTNSQPTDMAVEMNFQVAGAEKNLGSLTCVISSTAHPAVEVCHYEAQSAPYDGAPCWFILPAHASFTCTRVGIFYWLSTQVSPLAKTILSTPSAWKSLDVPKPAHPDGSGGSSSWTNQGSADVWVSLSLANPGFDAEFANCAVGYVHMCSFASEFGRVNASSCGFVVGAGETLACDASPGIVLLSATAFPLTTNIVPVSVDDRTQGQLWHNISCPFTTPLANNCPCSHNGSNTQDSLISLKLTSPTAGDNSIWCYSSQSEDLCSLSWNSGAKDSASCVFFLPASETFSCKVQFGTVLVEQAVEMFLREKIFAASPAPPAPGWERRVGDGVGRGPLTSHTDVPEQVIDAAWGDFKREYQRTFFVEDGDPGEEEMLRKRNFAHSLRQIRQLELLEPDAQFGATEFSDWSTEEWLQFATGGLKQAIVEKIDADTYRHAVFDTLALGALNLETSDVDGVDWRERGAVTPVKNQGTCGNCWAFSSTASTEAAWAIAGNGLVSLSEEFLTDCNYPQSPGGCKGGFPQQAFQFMIKNGIDTESSYNYTAGKTGKPSDCTRHWPPTSPVRIEDFINIPSDESAMKAFATARGPFAVGLDAAGPAWKQYMGGVLRSCCNHAQEHAPTVVGWGTEREGQHIGGRYWLVRNSWGPTWGERGYIRLEMGSDQCGITQSPSAPCVCKGCNTTSCAKPAPLPPTPPPIPPPPPPPAKEQTCKMAGGQQYTCPLDNPVCCSVQFGNVSSPGASHYCCNGPSPVCCKLGSSMWCCDGDEICSATKPNQCDKCAANSSRLSITPATCGTLLVTTPVTGEVSSGLSVGALITAAASPNTPALRSPTTWQPFGQLASMLGDPIGCKSDYSCELIYPICCDDQLHDDSHYCCESEHPVCCKSGKDLWCCGADSSCGNATGSCIACANTATPCASIKMQQNCTLPRCEWKAGRCGNPPAPPPVPPPPPGPPPPGPLPPTFACNTPPDGKCKTLVDGTGKFSRMSDCILAKSCALPPAPPPARKPDWKCPQGGQAQWRMDGKNASASCVFKNNTGGLRMPPTPCGTNCDYLDSHGYMGYTFDKQGDSKGGSDPDEWPCLSSMELGSNSNSNQTGSWFCTLTNGSHGVTLPPASSSLLQHCAECPSEEGCIATGSFSYSWHLNDEIHSRASDAASATRYR